MIICTHEKFLTANTRKHLSDSQIEISVDSDSPQDIVHLGLLRLLNDAGLTVILTAENCFEMSLVKNIVETAKNLDTLFVYPDIESDDIKKIDVLFKDSTLNFIKTNEALLLVLDKHRKENKILYENLTSTQMFINGLSKKIDESATLFTNNICTMFKSRSDDVNEEFFFLDIDIDNGQELTRLLKNYINDDYEYDIVENIVLKTTFMTKSRLELQDKIYLLMTTFKNK